MKTVVSRRPAGIGRTAKRLLSHPVAPVWGPFGGLVEHRGIEIRQTFGRSRKESGQAPLAKGYQSVKGEQELFAPWASVAEDAPQCRTPAAFRR
jgi:hypothetical protein